MGGRNATGRFPSKPAPIATSIELPARTRKTNRPILRVSTVRDARNTWAGERIEPVTSRACSSMLQYFRLGIITTDRTRILADTTTAPDHHYIEEKTVGYLRRIVQTL